MPDQTTTRPADATIVQDEQAERHTPHPEVTPTGVVAMSADENRDSGAPDVTHVTEPEANGEPAEAQHDVVGLRWAITDEANPFQRRLLFTRDSAIVLDLSLDPLLLQDLLYSLAVLRESQRSVLGIGPAGREEDPVPSGPEMSDDESNAPIGAGNDCDLYQSLDHALGDDWTEPTTPTVPDGTASLALAPFPSFGWWKVHKLLAFLLLFGAFFFVLGTINPS